MEKEKTGIQEYYEALQKFAETAIRIIETPRVSNEELRQGWNEFAISFNPQLKKHGEKLLPIIPKRDDQIEFAKNYSDSTTSNSGENNELDESEGIDESFPHEPTMNQNL